MIPEVFLFLLFLTFFGMTSKLYIMCCNAGMGIYEHN